MKEDKLDKDIAASLKKKLAEASVPYELGAWEAFQKKRALLKRREISIWVAGIAASILLIAIGLNSIDFSVENSASPKEIQLAENAEKLSSTSEEENRILDDVISDKSEMDVENTPNENTVGKEGRNNVPNSKISDEAAKDIPQQVEEIEKEALAVLPELVEKSGKSVKAKDSNEIPIKSIEKVIKNTEEITIIQPPLIAKTEELEKIKNYQIEKSTEESIALAIVKEDTTKVTAPITSDVTSEKQQFVAESDFPEVEKSKSSVGLGMGISPGFGAIQNDNQVATAQTIGVGMLVNISLPGKFTLGSGLGLNYLNQNTELQSTVMAFGNIYPQTEKLEVRQMQVEVPVFVKYPLTKNNSISLQAGFSNFYALNESGSQENSYNRQVANYSLNSDGFSSVTLSNQAVNSTSALQPAESKFYPFATLNFGLNLRLLESKNANYVIMPFYNCLGMAIRLDYLELHSK